MHANPKLISILSLFIIVSILLSGVQPVSALQKDAPKQRVDTLMDSNVSLLATNWYVTTNGNNANSCTNSTYPCLTINGAIGKSADGDTIYVATGIYTGDGTEVVLINKSVSISGGWNTDFSNQDGLSTIDGQNQRRGIKIFETTVVVAIDHFKIEKGFSQNGGGIYNRALLNLSYSLISNNVSSLSGGGISNGGGGITIDYTTISNNSSKTNGGGISSTNEARPGGYVILNNSTVSNNNILGYYSGSAIDNSILPFEINNSTISGNTTTWFDNIAEAITNSGEMTIKNSTISGNTHGGIINGFGTVIMQNSILANNTSSGFGHECIGNIDSAGYNLVGNTWFNDRANAPGCVFNSSTGDLVGTTETPLNPVLGSLQDNGGPTFTKSPLSGSPAINAANPASPGSGGNACLATDQRGTPRPVDAVCDIGAFEGQAPAIFVTITGNAGVAGIHLNYIDGTLKTVIADNNGNYSLTVLTGWSGRVTPSIAGHYAFFTPTDRNYNSIASNQTSQNYAHTLLSSLIRDPSFEASIPNPYWGGESTNFGTPLCTIPLCGTGGGTAGPRTGFTWVWFGGIPSYEHTRLGQGVILPSGFPNLKLQFYLWTGFSAPGSNDNDVFSVTINGTPIFSTNATQQALYPTYTPVLVDLSPYADGNNELLLFESTTNQHVVTFNLDDVSIANITFSDVLADQWAQQFIERLYSAGITGGCSTTPLNYCPENTVTRAQMAIFLLKGMHGSSFTPPAVGISTGFTDVPTDYWAAAWIKQLAAEGITSGCGGGNYCPEATVTRAQMAVFLLKAKNGSSYSPPAVGVSTGFGDVSIAYWAAPFIKQLVADGITSGCGNGNYCPDSDVTRAQMAVFLVKTFNLP